MTKTNHLILLSTFVVISFLSCSCQTSAWDNEVTKTALPLMVIDQMTFKIDYHKSCGHMSDCTAPLICADNKCDIPPSLQGKSTESTPILRFKTDANEHQIYLEVVSDDYTTQRGMMMRKAFHPDWGMLFVFPNESKHAFWMHNTYIPLDMVFIRADGSVCNTFENVEALNDGPRYPSTDRVKYVLELPSGSVSRYHINTSTVFTNISEYKTTGNTFYTHKIFNRD